MEAVASTPVWITLRELARRCGRTHRAAQKAIERGLIPGSAVRREGGRIKAVDVAAALEAWGADPAGGNRLAQLERTKSTRATPGRGAAADSAPAGGRTGGSRYDAKLLADTKRAEFSAASARLDYLERVGTLTDTAAVNDALFKRFRWWRDRVQARDVRLAPILAAEHDAARCLRILQEDTTKMLTEMADDAMAEGMK